MIKWSFPFAVLAASLFAESPSEVDDVREGLALRRIAEYWKEEDFSAAKGHILSFLSHHPESGYADHLRAMLGDIYTEQKEFIKALKSYREIEDASWKDKTRLSLIRCLFEEKKYQEVTEECLRFFAYPTSSIQEGNLARFLNAEAHYHLGQAENVLEKKQKLFRDAIVHYQVLKATEYGKHTLHPLASMLMFLGDYQEAASVYQQLSCEFVEGKEEFLFYAALCLSHVAPAESIKTFAKVHPLKGIHASESAFYEIELLFEQERYADLLKTYATTADLIAKKNNPLTDYYVGRALTATGDYPHAITLLSSYLKKQDPDKNTLKNALIALSLCAEKTEEDALFTKTVKQLHTLFGNETVVGDALLRHAQFSQKKGSIAQAKEDFQLLSQKFQEHPRREGFLYDFGLFLSELKEWGQAAALFEQFMGEFPQSPKLSAARRHQIFSLFEDLKATPTGTERVKRENLVKAIQVVMEDHSVFSKAEKKQIHYLLGKTLYDLKEFDEALVSLSEFLELYPKDAHAKQAHLLIAYSHLLGTQDEMLFVIHAEKALSENALLSEKETLHLQLYNAYLNLAQKERTGSKHTLIEDAANHLFAALEKATSKENLLWLAQYYENKSTEDLTYLLRSIAVLEKLLGVKDKRFSPSLIEPQEVEVEALKLSSLYEKVERHQDSVNLLKALEIEQKKNPDKHWKFQRRVLFELACAYEKCEETQKALDLYNFLIDSSSHTPSYFGPAASLHRLRLLYQTLPSKEGTEIQTILDGLKDLFLTRKLVSEPSHLEAGLTYIAIKTDLAPQEEKLKIALHLTERMKESLTSEEDPLVLQYLSMSSYHTEEKKLFDAYVEYLAAEIHRIQSVIQGSKELGKTAQIELEVLLGKPIHPSLKKWVELSRRRT